MALSAAKRDIIVVGASAGGLEALRVLLSGLPADFPASVFVVQHVGAVSHLARILDAASALPVVNAATGMVFEHGRVYVAIPDRHMLLHGDHILLRRGPRENLSRPAIDPLFRSAAVSCGSRVTGVVLSGALSDGTAGLLAIKRCGGTAIVQEPADAIVASMPCNALRYVDVDRTVPVGDMAALLSSVVRSPAPPTPPIPLGIRLEAAIAAQELGDMMTEDVLGRPSRFTCPECHGALWEIEDGDLLRYRCHVGHAFTSDVVLQSQGEEVDRLLDTLLRAHRERAALVGRMAENERRQGRLDLAGQLERRAADYEHDARIVEGLTRRGVGDREVVTSRSRQDTAEHEQDA